MNVEPLETRIAPAAAVFALTDLDGANGFSINENTYDFAGMGREIAVGDINGDGIDDLVIGAYQHDDDDLPANVEGRVYVIFGTGAERGAVLSTSSLNGTTGFAIVNDAPGGGDLGNAVAAGDFNGDGFDDVMIGDYAWERPNAPFPLNSAGAAYVIFGHAGGFDAEIPVSSLTGPNGFRVIAENERDGLGTSIAAADVNGDGKSDLIIGASSAVRSSPEGQERARGQVHIIFGGNQPANGTIDLAQPLGAIGVTIEGPAFDSALGDVLADVGDVNNDGVDDFAIADGHDRNYVIFGSGGFTVPDLDNLSGSNGFIFTARTGAETSQTLARGGDINGDGIDDLVFGDYVSGNEAHYVVYGRNGGFPGVLAPASLNGTNGFRILDPGNFELGRSITAAGDVDGDGFADLIIGSNDPAADPDADTGIAVLVYGRGSFPATLDLDDLDPGEGVVFSGNDVNLGGSFGCGLTTGADINGDGFDDIVIGAYNASVNNDSAGRVFVIYGKDRAQVELVNARTAQFRDVDGDLVTIKVTKGTLSTDDFTLVRSGSLGGLQLQVIDFGDDGQEFSNSNLTLTAVPQNGQGDGRVNVGLINAAGINLGKVTIPGDLGAFVAGAGSETKKAVSRLSIFSLGQLGLATQPGGIATHLSEVNGHVGSFIVSGDIVGATFQVTGSVNSATIGGSLVGGGASLTGSIVAVGEIGRVSIGEGMIGDAGLNTGAVISSGTIGAATIGWMQGGGGFSSGALFGAQGIGKVTVLGDVTAGTASYSGSIGTAGNLGSVVVNGGVNCGEEDFSGSIFAKVDAVPAMGEQSPANGASSSGVLGNIGSVLIKRNLASNAVQDAIVKLLGVIADSKLGKITIFGDLRAGIGGGISILAGGGSQGSAIKSLVIRGESVLANILAGFDSSGLPRNGAASIGSATFGGNLIGTNLAAGVDPNGDGFGNENDLPASGSTGGSIKNLVIAGQVFGETGVAGTAAGISAELIERAQIAGSKFPMLATVAQQFTLGFGSTASLFELGASLGSPSPIGIPLEVAGRTAVYYDVNGDKVTVTTNKGTFLPGDFQMVDAGLGQQLQKLDIHDRPEFKGATITFKTSFTPVGPAAAPVAHLGDGQVNVGFIDASGVDLAAVTINGDLGRIEAGDPNASSQGLGKLTVASMGLLGLDTQANGGLLTSEIVGKLGTLKVTTVISGATVTVVGGASGQIGTLDVGHLYATSIFGAAKLPASDPDGGAIHATGKITAAKVQGSLHGGEGAHSASIRSDADIGRASIAGTMFGGAGEMSGAVSGRLVGPVTIGGEIIGSAGERSASIIATSGIKSVKISGDMVGGAGEFSGSVLTHSANADDLGAIGSVTILGRLRGAPGSTNGIFSDSTLGAVRVTDDIRDVVISAEGRLDPASTGKALAIAGITVGGSIMNTRILAGYDPGLTATNADAAIGAVNIKFDWIASSIAAGIDDDGDGFGNANDTVFGDGEKPEIVSRIASIVIGRSVLGTADAINPTDRFAFTAETIGSFKVGKTALVLSRSTQVNDDFPVGPTGDVRVREL